MITVDLFNKYGWTILTGKYQKRGSDADIYAEMIKDDIYYYMLVEDGFCENALDNALYHIASYNFDNKIFEGRLEKIEDFMVIMRVLGFNDK